MKRNRHATIGLAGLALVSSSVLGQDAGSGLAGALAAGRIDLSLIYRYEHVDQADFALDASASLLKSRVSFTSADFHGFSLVVEVDDIRTVGADGYNSTRNGKLDRPIVADPVGTEINRFFVGYETAGGIEFAVGRQSGESSPRFLGSRNNWRLNEQTFDSLRVRTPSTSAFEGTYTFIRNANRLFGPHDGVPPADYRGRMHLFDGRRVLGTDTRLDGYAYLLDFDDAPELSNATVGLRLTGRPALSARISMTYALEVARQTDYADNTVDYTADYVVAAAGLAGSVASVTAGVEILSGNGRPGEALMTPLAGLHGRNGWADQFLTTPADGLEDRTLELAAPIGAGRLRAIYHDFVANRGDAHYGRELDVALDWAFGEHYTLLLKAAGYRADDHAVDSRKVWVMVSASF